MPGLLAGARGVPRYPPQRPGHTDPWDDVEEAIDGVGDAEALDHGRQPVAQAIGAQWQADVEERDQQDSRSVRALSTPTCDLAPASWFSRSSIAAQMFFCFGGQEPGLVGAARENEEGDDSHEDGGQGRHQENPLPAAQVQEPIGIQQQPADDGAHHIGNRAPSHEHAYEPAAIVPGNPQGQYKQDAGKKPASSAPSRNRST